MLQGNFVKMFNSTQTFKNVFFVLKFELILIIGSNNVLTEGARKVYRGRRVGQCCCIASVFLRIIQSYAVKSSFLKVEMKKYGVDAINGDITAMSNFVRTR
jgi:hypothetical protein